MTGAGRGGSTGRLGGDRRGQTVLDYAIGVGLFFVALVAVLGIIPGMFAPFTTGADAQIGDRVADSLASDVLGDPATPYVLDVECTWHFFEQLQTGTDAPTACRFDTTVDDPEAMFGLDSTKSLHITISDFDGNVASLEVDGDSRSLEAGDSIPTSASVTTARRNVHLDGQTYRLEVDVW